METRGTKGNIITVTNTTLYYTESRKNTYQDEDYYNYFFENEEEFNFEDDYSE